MLSTLFDKGGRSKRDKVDHRQSAKLIISPSSDARPLQFITGVALATAQFRRAGQLATADTCSFCDNLLYRPYNTLVCRARV